jgi:lipid II:glycine glycyltransferase (peptidoglycan interpeptide bridge formation enzyme)
MHGNWLNVFDDSVLIYISHVIAVPSYSTSIVVEVDNQTPESWMGIVAQFADSNIYQAWAYGATRWGAQNLSHLVLRHDGKLMAAAQLRIARVPVLPAGVAYLRWGPLCQKRDQNLDPKIANEMVNLLRDEYTKRRGLALQIIPNAFVSSARGNIYQKAFTGLGFKPEANASVYRTVTVDLTTPIETMRKRLDQKWRNQLNRSEKNGLIFEVSEERSAYREFTILYDGMLKRKQFESSVDVEEFGKIQDLLSGAEKMQIFLAKKESETVAALVCSLSGDTAIYLLGATNEKARELKASYFLQWQAMVWLKARGACFYDLGGIDQETNPGGYHFKTGFGGEERTQLPLHACSGGRLSSVAALLSTWRRRRSVR